MDVPQEKMGVATFGGCSPFAHRWNGQPPLPVVPFCPFWGEGSPTKIDYRKKGTLILTSLLQDLAQDMEHGTHFNRGLTLCWAPESGRIFEGLSK